MKNTVIILRGVSGAGKSTVAKLFNTKAICSADDYFMRNGEYKWYGAGLRYAHAWCERKCELFMKAGAEVIVIDNTSVKAKDSKAYYVLAKEFDYVVHSIIVENRHNGVNSHGVPEQSVDKMRARFEIKL